MSSRTSPSLPSAPSSLSVSTTTTACSSTPLNQTASSSKPKSPPKKDYAAAFSMLQTQYGWGHVTYVPVESAKVKEAQEQKRLAKERKEQEKARRREAKSAPHAEQGATPADQPPRRDYESAFGALSSKMGFGGSGTAAAQRKQ